MKRPWAKRSDAADAHRLRGRAGVERRRRWLEKHPLCIRCEEIGQVRVGTVVDHVVPLAKGGADNESNFATLCHEHDAVKTAADLGQRHRPRIGLDGWPIDQITAPVEAMGPAGLGPAKSKRAGHRL